MSDDTALTTLQEQTLAPSSVELAACRPLAEVVKAALAAAGRSEHTRRAYLTAAGNFLAWLDGEKGDNLPDWWPAQWRPLPDEWRPLAEAHKDGKRTAWDFGTTPAVVLWLADAQALDTWRLTLEAGGVSVNTASARVYAVRTLLSVALRDGIIPEAQARQLSITPYKTRQARDHKPVGRRLTVQEVRRLRKAVDTTTNKGRRDLAILDTMLYLGLRRAEVAGLRLSNFSQDGGRWWVILAGKGRKTRRLKLPDALYKSLTAWLEAAGLYWHDDRPVFYSVSKGDTIGDTALSPNDVGRLVALVGARANLAPATGNGRLGAHDLRRTAAHNAHDNGAPLLKVQQMLGHSDPSTTARYIGADEDDTDTATDYVRY